MQYLGSKNRISKYLKPVIESYITDETEYYVEPFVGGANMIDKIDFNKKIGIDVNEYLIELLKYIQDLNNVLPKEVSEEEYNNVKNNKEKYPKWYVGLVGFCCSFGSKWFGGYARNRKSNGYNYILGAINNLEKQRLNLQNIEFKHGDYRDFSHFKGSVIYCDIPYKNTTKFNTGDFDYEAFYAWCKEMKANNNIILVSEYEMPEGFTCIWEKEHPTIMTAKDKGEHGKRIERLFIVD